MDAVRVRVVMQACMGDRPTLTKIEAAMKTPVETGDRENVAGEGTSGQTGSSAALRSGGGLTPAHWTQAPPFSEVAPNALGIQVCRPRRRATKA
jgi:hypothetical protein